MLQVLPEEVVGSGMSTGAGWRTGNTGGGEWGVGTRKGRNRRFAGRTLKINMEQARKDPRKITKSGSNSKR